MFKPIAESQTALPPLSTSRAHESLYEVFHENTKYTKAHYIAHARQIGTHLRSRSAVQAGCRNFKIYRFSPQLVLPHAEPLAISLHHALQGRVSTRQFSGDALSLESLASVLIPAAACNRVAALTEFPPLELHLRSYPSGGGEFPVEIYPVLLRVQDLEPAVTHFDPRAKALSILNTSSAVEDLAACLMQGDSILKSASVLILLTAMFERSTAKYGDRGYRLILLEAGHLAQNLCLTAAAAGLGSLTWGGFFDDELNRFLGIDGVNEAAVHGVFIGGKAE